MIMDWLLIAGVIIAVYAMIAYYIKTFRLWEDHVVFYGPILAIKTDRVGFFDWFKRFPWFLRTYGTFGAVMVIVVSVTMTLLLVGSLQKTIAEKTQETAVNQLNNILAIPGLNDFLPLTFAVIIGLIVTMVVHEFGHAVLCRIEGIRVKAMGLLVFILPIGAFVEPNEEDLEKTKGMAKIRMLGAGIANNLVLGVACFVLLIFLLGLATPVATPLISGVYEDTPAYVAGLPSNSFVREVNGVSVSTRDDVARVLDTTRPGDTATIVVEKDGVITSHTLTLSAWPQELSNKTSGFMGVSYYDASLVKNQVFDRLLSPLGFLFLLVLPFGVIQYPHEYGSFIILINDSVGSAVWSTPFPHFWLVVQILFWCGWWNLAVGTFNALPLLPLDGGYILKEGVDRILDKKGLIRFSGHVVAVISSIMVLVIVAIFILPKLYSSGML